MLKLNRRAMIALAAAASAALTPAFGQDAEAPVDTAPGDFSIGNPDAKVKIIEYASFTCPHCADFHETVWRKLKKNYVDTGKVHFTVREFYRNRYDLWAALLARCGGQMRYYGIYDMLFEKQSEWAASDDPVQIADALKKLGLAAGFEAQALDTCLNDQAMAEALVKQFQTNIEADQVEGTPTLVVNGSKLSRPPTYDELAKIIDDELAK